MREAVDHLAILGAGRAGLALGLALADAGATRRLTIIGRSPSAPEHPLFGRSASFAASVTYRTGYESLAADPPSTLILAVPDAALGEIASALASLPLRAGTICLHLSGAMGAEVLRPLAERGCRVGSLHPLVALADARAAVRLRGAWYAVEGDAEAASGAQGLAELLEGKVLTVPRGAKARYHAAAVTASNFVVTLLGVAEGWMTGAGVPPEEARSALCALATGAVENVARLGPVGALTGPVARGDASTVQSHLSQLSPPDAHLYSVLALATLDFARQGGLEEEAAQVVAQLLRSKA